MLFGAGPHFATKGFDGCYVLALIAIALRWCGSGACAQVHIYIVNRSFIWMFMALRDQL